jgi:sigma-B regulation protein RsbU (phosphoserine phosphatase)
MVLDPVNGHGCFASAGHPPLLVAAGEKSRLEEPRYGPPLGTLMSLYEERDVELAPGETLLLYTDGVTEAYRNGELFGEERLLEAVCAAEDLGPQALIGHLQDAVVSFAGTLRDDVDILALRRTQL